MRGITAFGAVAALWLASATAGIAAPSLTVLCGVDEAWCAAMKKAYEAKAGIEISMTRRSTGDILNLIRAEKAAPSVDVWWGGTGDTHLQAGSENLLEPYQPTLERDMLPWAQNFFALSGGRSAGIPGDAVSGADGGREQAVGGQAGQPDERPQRGWQGRLKQGPGQLAGRVARR